MRNPSRIPELMEYIQRYWQANPDLRFNQLICNLQYEFHKDTKKGKLKNTYELFGGEVIQYSGQVPDLYYVEDEEFIQWLKEKVEIK